MNRTSFAGDACPVARTVDVVGDWWSLLIVRDAFAGRRFGEFQTSLGVAGNILTDRLKKLVAAGGTYREYVLSESGRGLLPVVVALGQWAARDGAGFALVDVKTGTPARPEFRPEDGRKLTAGEVRLVPAVQVPAS
jgi:DNA-binding HxlR family transcriptional regulator